MNIKFTRDSIMLILSHNENERQLERSFVEHALGMYLDGSTCQGQMVGSFIYLTKHPKTDGISPPATPDSSTNFDFTTCECGKPIEWNGEDGFHHFNGEHECNPNGREFNFARPCRIKEMK
jgi:hypothetical protein